MFRRAASLSCGISALVNATRISARLSSSSSSPATPGPSTPPPSSSSAATAAKNAYSPPPPPSQPSSAASAASAAPSSFAAASGRGARRGVSKTGSPRADVHKFSDNTADAAAYVGNDEVPDYNGSRHMGYLALHGRRLWVPLLLGVGYASLSPFLTTAVWKGAYATVAVLLQRLSIHGRSNAIRKDLRGYMCVVTGGTSGIGLYTALQLLNMGATVIVASKPGKEEATMAFFKANYRNWVPAEARGTAKTTPTASTTEKVAGGEMSGETLDERVHFVALNFENQIQVAGAVARIKQISGSRIDLLVNCAAVWTETPGLTAQGFEEHIGVNFLGPFHVTEALLPSLRRAPHRSGRVVYVTCEAHNGVRTANVVEERMTLKPTPGTPQVTARCYSASKLGNIYHAQSLARRRYEGIPLNRPSEQRPIDVCLADPGFCATGLQLARVTETQTVTTTEPGAPTPSTHTITVQRKQRPVLGTNVFGRTLRALWIKDALEGSQTVVNCCVRDSVENGQYYAECQAMPSGLSRRALDPKTRESVVQWAMTKTMDKYYEMKRK